MPCSVWGQLITIITAFFGIPLTLICLTRMGHTLELLLNRFWIYTKKILSRRTSRVHTKDVLKNEQNQQEDYEDYVLIVVPISFGLLVTFLWVSLCSVYFYFTLQSYYSDKNFTVFTAFYFTMVTFFTIGLGDVSPTNYQFVLITYLFIMIGLALVTMCIELLQDKLELFFAKMVKGIHTKYQNNVLQGEDNQTMSDNASDAKNNVKLMMDQNESALLKHFISKKDKKKLIGEWQNKAKMKVKGTQHEIVQVEREAATDVVMVDNETQHEIIQVERGTSTDTVLVDKEIMTDPFVRSVDVSSIGINVRVSHLERVGYLESLISH